MNQDIITTIKQVEDEANVDISKAQETNKSIILAKEKELREKLEKVEETLSSETKKIEAQLQKEATEAEKQGKQEAGGAMEKIGKVDLEKARKFVLDFLLSSE